MFPGPRNVFQILSASSGKAITKKWLKPEIPKVDDWCDIIHASFRISFSIGLQQEKFLKKDHYEGKPQQCSS